MTPGHRTALGIVLALSAFSLQAQQPPPPQQPVTVPGAFNFSNASLIEVINILAQELHINYIIDPSVKGGTVTMNTYGQVRDVDIRPLLETILRMNNLAMVQVGNVYRIIPAANIARQPVSPITETDPSKVPDDERIILNLVFLRYVSSSEMYKILQPYMGDGAQLTSYDPANLLIILDNSRNMRRTLELIALFDNDAFAGQRVRAYDVKNGRPSDLARELDDIFKAYTFSGDKGSTPVHFIPVNRINTILAVAPNPGAFKQVDTWLAKLDVPAKPTAGSVDNYFYKLKYAKAEVVGSVVIQLYGGCGSFGGYGPTTGYSGYPASGTVGTPFTTGGYGGGGYPAAGMASPYGGAVSPYGGASPYGYAAGGYGTGAYPGTGFAGYGGFGGAGVPCVNPMGAVGATSAATASPFSSATTGSAAPNGTAAGAPASAASPSDQTGQYLATPAGATGARIPRIVPNSYDNSILVQGTPEEWEQIKHLLDQLDIPPRQVLIDAKIYEVDLTGAFQYGVETALQQKDSTARELLGTVAGAAAATPGALTLTAGMLVGHSRELLATLTANENKTKAKVLSAPSVIATDSIPASITVGSSVPTLTSEAVSPGITVGGTSQFTNTISNTSTGIGLNILARVNPSGVVTMVINQNVTAPIPNPLSSTGASGASINSPSFSQRNVSTQVTVEDGDTIAIGGIIMDSTTETTSGIPFLDRIPYLGAAFGQKTWSDQRTELIIFLTPRVIYDTTQITDATEELKQKVKGLTKMIREE